MEFGIFTQAAVPKWRWADDDEAEHTAIMRSVELSVAAEKAGFKYAWTSEHHGLSEYSHLSAPEVLLSYLAAKTETIHLGAAIMNPLPAVNHPARTAERVALLDHLSQGRFEFGTGRGAGTYELGTFGIPDNKITKDMWDEVIPEFLKIWSSDSYEFHGKYFDMPARNIVPKPWRKSHPAMWVAAGNPPTYEKAARLGLGVLGFFIGSIYNMAPCVDSYKNAIDKAEPVGLYVNNNVMLGYRGLCLPDPRRAREAFVQLRTGYYDSLVYHRHDTFPRPDGIPYWPEVLPEPTLADVDRLIDEGKTMCGDPAEVIEQVRKIEAMGVDQLMFTVPYELDQETALEVLDTFGRYVIPEFDKDPVHRTTRFREESTRHLPPRG